MKSSSSLRVLFRAPAGARRGFGHLVRCLSLARALGVRPLIALRGRADAADVALALGAELISSPTRRTLRALAPDVVVIDDPVAGSARRWIAAARRAGAIVVTIHDLGLGAPEGDLVIDGSATRAARGRKGTVSLAGSRYALLDPRIAALRSDIRPELIPVARTLSDSRGEPDKARPTRSDSKTGNLDKTVVISLGGGPHAQTAEAIADVAIVGGGMSLYEACAMGVPAAALPVVAAQTPTVRAFAQRGAAIAMPAGAQAREAADAAVVSLTQRG